MMALTGTLERSKQRKKVAGEVWGNATRYDGLGANLQELQITMRHNSDAGPGWSSDFWFCV